MSDLLQRVENGIRSHRLLPPGQCLLVAVSGGVDSMVLLHLLQTLAGPARWRLAVAHFHHQLRGRASDADERLVCRTAEKLSLPYFSERGDVADYARQAGISVEMAARKLRHEFLARTAKRQKIPVIALAHHADDQVELFFLRLLRGAGGEGLAGMKRKAPSPADPQITLVRPLLDFTKAELAELAQANRVAFREDASNGSNDPLRNRLRNELLPLLRQNYQPGLTATVLRAMNILGAEAEFSAQTAQTWLVKRRPPSPTRERTPFDQLPVAIQRKVLQEQLTELQVIPCFDLIEQLRQCTDQPMNVAPGVFLVRTPEGKLSRHKPPAKAFQIGTEVVDLTVKNGKAAFGGRLFDWTTEPLKTFTRPKPQPFQEQMDADKIGPLIVLRHWQPGDRFQPIGLPTPAKLQDLFVNAKIPAPKRRELVVAETVEGVIFWVEGLRIGEAFKLTPDTWRKLIWNWQKKAA